MNFTARAWAFPQGFQQKPCTGMFFERSDVSPGSRIPPDKKQPSTQKRERQKRGAPEKARTHKEVISLPQGGIVKSYAVLLFFAVQWSVRPRPVPVPR